MKLEIGKRYVTRYGGVTEPLRISVTEDYPYTAKISDSTLLAGFTWTEDGRQGLDLDVDEPYDIVAEYCEPAPEVTPEPRKLVWVPGRTYKTRNGGLVFIILVDEGQSYPVTGFRIYPGEDAEQFPNTWTIDGKRHMGNVESSFDIVDYAYEVGDDE